MDDNTVASKIISFLAGLHGLDVFFVPIGNAAIDLRTGMIIRPSFNYPDGLMLVLEYAPGSNPDRIEVSTHKLVNSYLLRHAWAEYAMNGGNVKDYFEHIHTRFSRETGNGL
jgi:hypothetical protein